MNHNLQPAAEPPVEQRPDPNVLESPNVTSSIPEENQPWAEEDQDRRELREILRFARQLAGRESQATDTTLLESAQANLREAQRNENPNLITVYTREVGELQERSAQAQRNRKTDRKDNQARLLQLIGRGNPTAILTALNRHHEAANNQITESEKNAGETRATADKALRTTEAHYDDRHNKHLHAGVNATGFTESEKKTVAGKLADINSTSAKAWYESTQATDKAERAERDLMSRTFYRDEVESLIEIAESVYGQNWGEMQRLNHNISMDLRRWDIAAGPDSPTLPDQVRDKLKDLKSNIDALPRSDARRAEGLADHNRLLYRFMSRVIREETVSGQQQRSAEFMRSGGIRLTGEPTVIFADGSVERQDQSTGEWIRRTPDGQIWNPVRKELDPQAEGPRNWRVALAKWEESRTHHDAQEAYASLSEYMRNTGPEETKYVAGLEQTWSDITQNDSAISDMENQDTSFDTTGQAEKDRQNELTRLRAEREELKRKYRKQDEQLSGVRLSLNRARYWHGFLEIDAERKESQPVPLERQGLLARFLISRQLKPVYGEVSLPSRNQLRPDGSIVFDQMTMNGLELPSDEEREEADARGTSLPQWQVWPGGEACRYDPKLDGKVFYDPQGHALV